jgi:hypothetical protein
MTAGGAVRSESGTTDLPYPWPRFWVPRDGVIDLSDAGFLRDPADWLASPHVPVPLAALHDRRSLALLGEPGIGKSTTLKEEADRMYFTFNNRRTGQGDAVRLDGALKATTDS